MKFNRLTFHLILLFVLLSAIVGCANNNAQRTLEGVKQNVNTFVNPKSANHPLISATEQEQRFQDFITHYFSPWTGKFRKYSDLQIQQNEMLFMTQFGTDPGWSENFQKHTNKWLKQIRDNMSFDKFPNNEHPAITINNSNMRILPTDDPSYSSPTKAGEWYPFDNLQESYVAVNTPVLVLQTSKDKAWDLVLTHNDCGWIHSVNIATVDPIFEKEWQSHPFIALTTDDNSIIDTDNFFRFKGNLGTIFPLLNSNKSDDEIQIAIGNETQNAVIKTAIIPTTNASTMPLSLTASNIATIANRLLGNPYGWGGMYGYRDCSSTMADLFTPFGIWLPRNSSDQLHIGRYISLEKLSPAKKEQFIQQLGVPFLTLIGLPGHVMLYIGQKNGNGYVFHDFWGLHTENIFLAPGRAIVGETAVTSLKLGRFYLNVPQTLITRVNGMTVLG